MDWHRIVDSGSDPLLRQKLHHSIPILNSNRVDVMNMYETGFVDRDDDAFDSSQGRVISRRMRTAGLISFFETSQFDPQNGSLNSIHAAIPAYHGVMIFPDLSVIPEDA